MNRMTIAILTFLAALNFSCGTSSENKAVVEKEAVVVNSEEETPEILASADEKALVIEKAAVQEKMPMEEVKAEKQEAKKAPVKAEESKIEKERERPVEESIESTEDAGTEVTKEEVKEKPSTASKSEEPKETKKGANAETATAGKPDHAAFNDLLGKYVSSKGVVNYEGIKGDLGKLDAYLKGLAANTPAGDWSSKEKLAYWINAYNAYTIKLILDNYPVKSIQDIAGGKPWDKKWIKLGDKTYSLNQIENDIIRPTFKEPRIHFAVNCAAKSCPPLANKAFTADNMNTLLEKQAKAFITDSKYNQISANSAKVSKIFDWYGKDFGNLKDYLNKYATTKIAAGTSIEFSDYDWSLNN